MRIFVGLGNPGPRYQDTRHNVGFRCLDALAQAWTIPITDRRATATLGQGTRRGQPVVLAKPRTYMNNSGEGVAYLLARFGARPADLVIIYDDLHLPVGKLRIRPQGSDGGHNGIRSIIAAIQSQDFPRIRVGIGQPPSSQEQIGHVIGRFTAEETKIIGEIVEKIMAAADALLQEPIATVMNRFN